MADKQKEYEEIIKETVKNLLPNISKTGFDEVDETYKPKPDKAEKEGLMNININPLQLLKDKKVLGFTNFIKLDGLAEDYDLNLLLSTQYNFDYFSDN